MQEETTPQQAEKSEGLSTFSRFASSERGLRVKPRGGNESRLRRRKRPRQRQREGERTTANSPSREMLRKERKM